MTYHERVRWSEALPFEIFHSDLITNGVSWPSGSLSPFDEALRTAWQSRLDAGLFRYQLRSSPLSRVLSPPHDVRFPFVAQLNPERSSERRPPQRFASVQQPFDQEAFHFGRIPCREVLFELRLHGETENEEGGDGDYVVINVSPLEFGHVLLLPQPGLLLPQALSVRAVRLALRTLLLSAHPGFRVGFNSLRAFASVNHLHLHAYYLEHRLPVEWTKLSVIPGLRAANPLRLALPPATPIPSFVVLVDPEESWALEKLTYIVCQLVQLMAQREIAHNVMFTRGEEPEQEEPEKEDLEKEDLEKEDLEKEDLEKEEKNRFHFGTRGGTCSKGERDGQRGSTDITKDWQHCKTIESSHERFETRKSQIERKIKCHRSSNSSNTGEHVTERATTGRCMVSMVRAFIWPRKSSPETKNLGAFNVALCELAGHLPVGSREHFDVLCWHDAATALKDQALSEQDFAVLEKDVVKLLNNCNSLVMTSE
uniref:GDP-D-glucose phosphorylase 1-like n=1 Tax=Myxine glutinosa TaxID=7769 RepID=UPI00358E45E4